MKMAGSECWVRGVVWVLIVLPLPPPAVLAQTVPGGAGPRSARRCVAAGCEASAGGGDEVRCLSGRFGEASPPDGPERRDDRERQGNGGHGRGAPVAEEQPHDEDREHRTLDEHLHRRVVRRLNVTDGGAGFGEADVRIVLCEPVDDLARVLRDTERARAPGAHDLEADHGLAVQQCNRALLAGLLGNIGMKTEEGDVYLGARGVKFAIFPGSGLKKNKPKWVVAAELTETARLYARCAAKIEPEWVEGVAGHLVKRHYFDPHWERKRGMVNAWERVTLYGLTLVSRRRVHYGPLNPAEAREVFIRQGLAAGEIETKGPFLAHNQKLIAEIRELELPTLTLFAPGSPISRTRTTATIRRAQLRIPSATHSRGLEAPVSPHWLRHAHASHALDRGAPIHLVQTTLGHASVATTGRYLHARPSDSSSRYLGV